MTSRSHLVRTPITDRNGKQTTVLRKPQGSSGAGVAVPAPTVAARESRTGRAEAYADRLAAVAAANAAYRADVPGRLALVETASEGMPTLTKAVAHGHRGDAEYLAAALGEAFEDGAYSRVIMADRFGGLYSEILYNQSEDPDLNDLDRLLELDSDAKADAGSFAAVITVAETLQSMELVALPHVPDSLWGMQERAEDERDLSFLAHLYAHARGDIDYRDRDDNGDIIRLIDEFPERVKEVITCSEEGLHPAAIRARWAGEVEPALATGVL